MIKYYRDIPFVAVSNVQNGRIGVKTWFILTPKEIQQWKYRRGLCIKKGSTAVLPAFGFGLALEYSSDTHQVSGCNVNNGLIRGQNLVQIYIQI